MMVLKSYTISSANAIAEFVNVNGIKREDIYTIVAVGGEVAPQFYTIYYYADNAVKEKTKSIFGWS